MLCNRVLQILYTVAALHIADILGREGPQTSQQLAESIGNTFCPQGATSRHGGVIEAYNPVLQEQDC